MTILNPKVGIWGDLGGIANPTLIPGLQLWYKADAITGLVDGDPVVNWNDSGALGNTLSQAMAAKRPTYKVGIIGGKPVVRFDGVDDFLSNATHSVSNYSGLSLFLVVKFIATSALQILVAEQTAGGGGDGAMVLASRDLTGAKFSGTISGADSTETNIGKTAVTTDAKIMNLVYSTGDMKLYLNGAQDDTSAAETGNLPGTQGGFFVGAYNNSGTPSFLSNADIAEIILYNRRLTNTERNDVVDYLNDKYQIY